MIKISNALRRMAQGELVSNYECGICGNLLRLEEQRVIDYVPDEELSYLMRAWPEFSGDGDFPVWGGQHRYHSDAPKWGDDEYGRARKRLCIYLAEKFEEVGR